MTYVDGAAANYVKGCAFGYASSCAANNFKFNTNSTTAKEIANFKPATDTLTVKSNLNGGSWSTGSVAAACPLDGLGNRLCNFGSGMTVKLTGVTASLSHIVID